MKKTEKEQAAWLIAVSGANPGACMRCGRCTAACPVAGEMDIKPHHFASFLLHGQAGALLQSQSIWVCLSCMACSERCPRGVDPARLMEAVRQGAVRPRGETHLSPDDVPALLKEDMPQQALAAAFRKYRK